MQKVRCPQCGAENFATDAVCLSCGISLMRLHRSTAPAPSGQGLAIAALVLGILAVMFVCIPPLSALVALLAIVLGVLHLRQQGAGTGMAVAGISVGAASLLATAGLFVLYLSLLKLLGGLGSEQFNPYKNKPAPNFTLTDIQGRTHTLAQYRGKVVVLNFWATW